MASEKDYSSAMAFNESFWKSLAGIESWNKLLVTKKPSGIWTCNLWRMEENPRKHLFKSHEKL